MLKRVFAALVFGGLLVGLAPTTAGAAPERPAGLTGFVFQRTVADGCYGCDGPHDYRDDHYRCMYHCDERYGYGRRDGYDRYRYDRYRHGRYRYDRTYHDGDCWYHDGWGWHRCGYGYGYGYRYRYRYDGSYSSDYGGYDGGDGNDSAHASGGYDSHRHHPRG